MQLKICQYLVSVGAFFFPLYVAAQTNKLDVCASMEFDRQVFNENYEHVIT